jgi:hypothetical protein
MLQPSLPCKDLLFFLLPFRNATNNHLGAIRVNKLQVKFVYRSILRAYCYVVIDLSGFKCIRIKI